MVLLCYWVKNKIFQRITRITWQLFHLFGSIRISGLEELQSFPVDFPLKIGA